MFLTYLHYGTLHNISDVKKTELFHIMLGIPAK